MAFRKVKKIEKPKKVLKKTGAAAHFKMSEIIIAQRKDYKNGTDIMLISVYTEKKTMALLSI